MTQTTWKTDVKLAGASALATTLAALLIPGSPLFAAERVFASGDAAAASTDNGAGEQQVGSGIVQLKLDDGTTVSIVGPASYSIDPGGQLKVVTGSFTASAPNGSSPRPILAGNGGQVSLRPGSSANGKIAGDGSFAGFALSGSVRIASNGSSRNFRSGSAFRAGAGSGPSAVVTAGAQPNRTSGGQTPLQQIQQAQTGAALYLANPSQTTPTSLGFGGVPQTQTFVPGTLQASTTPTQFQAVVQAQTGPLDPAVALRFINEIFAAQQTTGGLGSYTGLTPAQIQALLFNLQTNGAPSGISQFQLEQFLRALGAAGFNVTGIAGQGPSFGSLADLLALVAAGGTIPPGDPTVQALVDILFANAFPPGLDVNEIARLFRLAGYTVPPQFGGGTGGTPTPSPTPTPAPTPTPPPVLAASDGVRPDGSRSDINLAFAKITETGQDSPVTLIFDAGEFVGYRLRSGFEIKFDGRDEVEKGGDKGIIGWSRLVGGTKALGAARGPNSGDHFVYGLPMVNAPSGGLLQYDLIGYTSPTIRDDSVAPGVFSGKFSVNFGTAQILAGLEATVTLSDSVYNIMSSGGVLAPSIGVLSDGRFNGTIDIEDGLGIACNVGDCRFVYNGFLAGQSASHAGFAYTIRDDAQNVFKWIDGSAAFSKAENTGTDPDPITKTFRGVKIDSGFVQPTAGNFNSLLDVTRNFLTRGEIQADEGRAFRIDGLANSGSTNKTELTSVRVKSGVGDAFRSIGTAKNADNGALGDVIGWTRWTDGEFANLKGGNRVLAGSESIHYIWGDRTTGTLPTGRAEYALSGGTRPTRVDGMGDPGTFEGELAINFATLKMGWDTIVGMGNDRFNFLSSGGLDNLSVNVNNAGNGIFNFTGDGMVVSELGRCQGCTGSASGFVSGADGKYVGFAYEIGTVDFGAIQGVAGFEFQAPASTPPTGTVRSNQFAAYAAGANVGIDAREIVDVTYAGTSGAPIGYVWKLNDFTTENERPNIGTAKENESGSVGEVIGWTRWADGKTGGRFYGEQNGLDFGPNQGFHLVTGTPATNLPTTGTVTYALAGATAPTIRDGSLAPGSFSGNLAVAFGATPLVGMDFAINIEGNAYGFGTPGGAADPTNGGRPVETTGDFALTFGSGQEKFLVTGNGPICGGSGDCIASFRGFLAGEGASHIGVSYTFGNGTFDQRVDGVAAFGKQGSGPTVTSTTNWSGWTAGGVGDGANFNFDPQTGNRLNNGLGIPTTSDIRAIREALGPNFAFQ
ncbi:hypothetical protein [Parasphingorhabdus halotolerans]|uniref:Uncharacterized protein n=1 Tax=Parasphingorhabdus halotolerans TaxID=2725558 RepID=A0A6H2DR53_9SPHN|nr:hypothetical protein [Parasphingorhabdus halotolerans]QJB70463.1 hypothetical protein HF685_15325 [Parasphingorhabdus halotolerans]